MKKTLLAVAAALAASVISSQAQVYSQNVVGYYNAVTPTHKFSFFANQLVTGTDVAQTNCNVNLVLTNGFTSDPNGNTNSVLYVWTGAGYGVILSYFNGSDADNFFQLSGAVNGWYDGGGNYSSQAISPGVAGFIYNAASVPITNTFVGTVPQGTNLLTIPTGFKTFSIEEPIGTNIDSALTAFPGTSDPNGNNNDTYYLWTGTGFGVILQYFTGSDADNFFQLSGAVNGWYDAGGNDQDANPADSPTVGQGFMIHHFVAPVTWTNVFNVQ
jgi:hypothetical protein